MDEARLREITELLDTSHAEGFSSEVAIEFRAALYDSLKALKEAQSSLAKRDDWIRKREEELLRAYGVVCPPFWTYAPEIAVSNLVRCFHEAQARAEKAEQERDALLNCCETIIAICGVDADRLPSGERSITCVRGVVTERDALRRECAGLRTALENLITHSQSPQTGDSSDSSSQEYIWLLRGKQALTASHLSAQAAEVERLRGEVVEAAKRYTAAIRTEPRTQVRQKQIWSAMDGIASAVDVLRAAEEGGANG